MSPGGEACIFIHSGDQRLDPLQTKSAERFFEPVPGTDGHSFERYSATLLTPEANDSGSCLPLPAFGPAAARTIPSGLFERTRPGIWKNIRK
jgi:hypothetical protein